MAIQTLGIDPEMQQCIDNCLECHAVCERTAVHCLGMGGAHASRDHQTALKDCAQICATSADFMIRESPIHPHTCAACAAACERCERQCRDLADGDSVMLQCAETCRRCAETCGEMGRGKG